MKQKPLFISYASEDRDVASHVVEFLESMGQLCWIAPRNILPAEDWAESIIDGIDSAAGMVLLLSRYSNESPQVRREVERAVDKGITIYPLLLASIKLSKWMQYYISAHQWNDASDVSLSSRLEDLFQAIEAHRAKEESSLDLASLSSLLADDLASLSAELDASGNKSERLVPGERRKVSVLHIFADLSRRDASPSVRIAVSKTAVNLVERYVRFYGGYLERLSLSSYRCLFGLEQVQEDDSRRALSCGMCVCNAFGELNSLLQGQNLTVDFGLGIASGMIEVDDSGEGVSEPHGEAFLNARELAEETSGSLLVTGNFHHSVQNEYSWEEHSKGVYRMTDCGMVLPGPQVFLVQAPFVGREKELSRLNALMKQQDTGTGRNSREGAKHLLMGIKGEAGIGKSRLVHEFTTKHCSDAAVFRGQTLSFAQPSCFMWTGILRDILEIEPGSDLSYSQFLERLKRHDRSDVLSGSAPFLAELLSIKSGDSRLEELDARGIALETGIAFSKLLRVLSGKRKLVVVLEDLHWLDDNDGKILKFVTDNCTTDSPIVFLLVYRPEREDGTRVTFATDSVTVVFDEIVVAEVDEKASKSLVRQLLESISEKGVGRVDTEAEKFLLDRSGGNPFFLEELVFDLVESGKLFERERGWRFDSSRSDLSVPDSLNGLLQSRLGRLPESWKSVLQNSSVLGMEFQLKLYWKLVNKLYLGRCHHDVFDGLEQKQMLRSEISAFERKYFFRHILVHDTAYGSILEDNLKKLHKAAAESIEEMFPNERERVSGILMHHYEKAGEKDRAIEYGFAALEQYTGKELLRLSGKLEKLLSEQHTGAELEENLFKILSYREKALDVMADREEQRFTIERMISIADSRKSDSLMAVALKNRGAMAMVTGCMKDALADMTKALELDRKAKDRPFQGIVLGNLGSLLANQGNIDEAEEYFRQALEIHREEGDRRSEGIIMMNLGIMLKARGRMDEARANYEKTLEIAREVGDRRTVADVLGNTGSLLWTMGFLKEAEEYYRKSIEKQREIGNRRSEGMILGNLAMLLMNQKKYDEALLYYENGLKIIREIGESVQEGCILGNLGVLYAEQGMDDQAALHYEKALEIHRRSGNHIRESAMLGNLGNINMRRGQLQSARKYYEEAIRINSESGNELENGYFLGNLGCLCFQEGDTEEAHRCYMNSYGAATEMRIGKMNYDGFTDLRGKLLSAGYSHEDLPWPAHWEPFEKEAPQPESNC